jgi:hypothetical protein
MSEAPKNAFALVVRDTSIQHMWRKPEFHQLFYQHHRMRYLYQQLMEATIPA